MREPRDRCRDVPLASGETIRVRGRRGLGPAGVAALSELVEAVRAKAAENPSDEGAAELWARIEAARGRRTLRECAAQAGVKFSVLFRIGTWLTRSEPTDNNQERTP